MTAAEGRALLEWDWLYTQHANRLHHVPLTDEQAEELGDNSQLEETAVVASCGRRLYWPSIPGLFSRMGMARCSRCCDRLGYPRGVGSPKNDTALHPLIKARLT